MGRRLKLTVAQADDIKWWKKHTDLSDEKIGKRFGVSGPTVAKVVTGNYRPTGEHMQSQKPQVNMATSFTVGGAIIDALADPSVSMTMDQIRQALELLKIRHGNAQALAVSGFKPGDKVTFTGQGKLQEGVVKNTNTKSVTVMVGAMKWSVSPGNLTKVG